MASAKGLSEAKIRDYLAQNLDCIEPGLDLIAKEYELPNLFGAKGFVDILARDKFGHRVVIEIKRSDSVARAALHELHKYVALLRNNHGLASEKIRCLVLSTDWHELLVPFSEYARSVDYHVEGRQIRLTKDSISISEEPIELAPEGSAVRICPRHMILFFHKREVGDAALKAVDREMKRLGVRDYVGLLLERNDPSTGYYPFGLYLAVQAFSPDLRLIVERRLAEEDEDVFDGDDWPHERAVLSKAGLKARRDESEIGSPEKFGQMRDDWSVALLARRGRFKSSTLTDEEIFREITGVEGDNAVFFQVICSPRYKPSWGASLSKSAYSLKGNSFWQKGFEYYMREAEADPKTGSVSIVIYNPLNFIMSLYYLLRRRDTRYVPIMQLLREDKDGQELSMLIGYLDWDGKTRPDSPVRIVEDIFGGIWNFFVNCNFGQAWQQDPAVLERHGFQYALIELTFKGGVVIDRQQWSFHRGQLKRHPFEGAGLGSIFKFIDENASYVERFLELMDKNVIRAGGQ
jgi:hypothetical protein